MTCQYQSILIFGAPGVGKGTQGKLIGNIPGFYHLATGDVFRSLDKESELGQKFTEYSSKGLLVPDEFTIKAWQGYMDQKIAQGEFRPDVDVLLLDGLPRNVNQAKIVNQYINVLRIIHLKAASIDELVLRMKKRAEKEGRADDADESVIRRRFEVYDAETAPVLDCYDKNLISEVIALGTPAEVLLQVLQAIVPMCRDMFENPLG